MSSLQSLLFYIGIFGASSLIFAYGHKKKIALLKAVALIGPILVGGLRSEVGTDYNNYLNIFNTLDAQSFTDYWSNGPTEVGLYVIGRAVSLLGGGDVLFFLVFSAITIVFFYLGLRKLKLSHEPLVFFLFLFTAYPGSFNLVRQSAAISIVFYAYGLLQSGKRLRFAIWGIAAGLIHMSSLLALLVIYLTHYVSGSNGSNIRRNNQILLIKSLLPTLAIVLLLPFAFILLGGLPFLEKYAAYEYVDLSGENHSFFLKLAIFLLIGVLAYKIIHTRNERTFFGLTAADTALTFLGFIAAPIKRISMYFSPFPLLLLPKFIDIFSDKLGKFICYLLLVVFGITFFVLSFYIMGQAEIFPYKLAV